MELQISNEELIEAYKDQVSKLSHELLVRSLAMKKLDDKLREYEKAEADRTRAAMAARAAAATQTGEQAAEVSSDQQPA